MQTSVPEATAEANRIVVLDLLRGMALLGMFVVHFMDFSAPNPDSAFGRFVSSALSSLVEGKAYTTFAILFGAGFALQLRQAHVRGERLAMRFIRRMLGLAAFGFVAAGIFGFNVLISYAAWGLMLLLVWRWSTPTLVVLVILCAASQSLYNIAAGGYQWATLGVDGARQANTRSREVYQAARQARRQGEEQPSLSSVIVARLRFMKSFYTQAFSFTPSGSFVMFLLGLLGLRYGVWDSPRAHRRLILGIMGFGLLAWILAKWVLPLPWPVLPIGRVSGPIRGAFQLFRDQWLAFTYIGGVLLLVAADQRWTRRLHFFALAGRMALTNYMIQVVLIDVLFRPYGFNLSRLPVEFSPIAALALFAGLVAFDWWWLKHFRLGPAEWVLRSITYARLDSIRPPRPILRTAYTQGAVCIALSILMLPSALSAQTPAGPVPLSNNPQRLEIVADLWGRVYLFHPAIPSQGIDWQAAVKALPRLERASSTEEFATALNEHLLSVLKDPAVFVHRREANKIDTPAPANRLLTERLGYLDLRSPSVAGTSSTALKSAVASLGAIDSLVLDLRWVMPDDSDPPSTDWLRQFLFAPTQVGPVVNRVHEGWNEFNTPGTYQQRWSVQSPRLLRGPDEPIRLKLIVLVNNKSYYACEQYLDALQSSSHAAVVWEQTANFLEGPYGQRRGVVRYAENLEFRLPHQTLISHTGALRVRPDLILRSAVRDEDLTELARSALTGSSRATKSELSFSYQMRLGKPPREVMANLTREERLLGLIKIWNVVRYLYPNLDLASTDWSKYLRDSASKVEAATTLGEYYSILNESVTPLNDGHVAVRHRLTQRAALGNTPYRLAKIEGVVIVAAVMAGKDTGALKVGDEIVSIDGEPVADIEAKHRKRNSVSTPDALYRFWSVGGLGPRGEPAIFEIRREGMLHRISVERSLPNFGARPPTWQENAPAKEIAGDIGYLNLRTISSEEAFRQAFSDFRSKRGLVLDMRGNPSIFMGDWIATRLSPGPVSVAHNETPLVFSHDLLHRSVIRHPARMAPDPDQFAGRVVALIETGPQSAAETMVGLLKSTGRVTLVGTRTMGTNGGTTQIYLPAGGSMQIAGQRALFPDGSRFQGVGYAPDVLAAPTIKGIVAGRDEVLEKGIETVTALIQRQRR